MQMKLLQMHCNWVHGTRCITLALSPWLWARLRNRLFRNSHSDSDPDLKISTLTPTPILLRLWSDKRYSILRELVIMSSIFSFWWYSKGHGWSFLYSWWEMCYTDFELCPTVSAVPPGSLTFSDLLASSWQFSMLFMQKQLMLPDNILTIFV